MKYFISIVFIFTCYLVHTQELKEEKKKKKELNELKKELLKKKIETEKITKHILENKAFNQKKSFFKSQKKINQKQFEKLSLEKLSLEKIQKASQNQKKEKIFQTVQKASQKVLTTGIDESESENTKVPEPKDKAKEEVLQNDTKLISDNTRLRGPTQFDSRIEVRELNANIDWQWLILQRKKSVGIIIDKKQLKRLRKDIFQLNLSNSLKKIYNLCKEEPFVEQPIVGIGTTFIIDSNIMLTANHVLTKTLENYAVIFGYELVNKNNIVESIISSNNIYYIKKRLKSSKNLDFVTFEVDREIENRPPLRWKESSSLKNGNEIYMIGHPSGLPKKIALNASITEDKHHQYFYTSLDSFQGNSGSPVFDFVTHRVIGVLVSGELDYKFNGNCYQSTLCKIPYCKGEKVIRIENIMRN